MERLWARARAVVVGGFAVTVVGAVIYMGLLIHLGYFSANQSVAFEGQIVLPILGDAMAMVAWWWLTRLRVTEPDQLTMVRRGFYALGLQALFIGGSVMCSVSIAEGASNTDQLVTYSLVIEAIGSFAVFVGFILIAGVYTPRRELPRELPREQPSERATDEWRAWPGRDDDNDDD
ncbi:MAG: hypothetical protein ACRDV0_06975 [Acidimicrobiales bacterium]